eukprot:4282365-Pyramimonas_sp.AAC.1
MFSRDVRMADMLLVRPPPRWLLERCPPASVKRALRRFASPEDSTVARAARLAGEFGITLPKEE